MSDNLRRYRAIRDALTQCYPGQPSGTVARHLITLAALISGIVGSKSTQLPHIATKVPDGTKPESRVKRIFPPDLSRLLRITLWEHWCSRAERAWKCLPTFCASSSKVVMGSPTRRESPFDAHPGSASASLQCP